ncbi:MAG: DUF2807 domain-containing protein [Paludibacteraceae bacterium]|nr:DUF2807 domain-containing protein [Paludibacteraceae bacterium]
MKLTRSINLQGVVFNIDEDAYQLLRDYLADIESRLPGDEQKDVMSDIESRIAELLQSALFAQKVESVTIDMVRNVRTRIGEPDEFGENKRPVFKRERISCQGIGRVLTIVLKAILIIIVLQLAFPVLAVLFSLLAAFFGVSIGGMALIPALGFELLGGSTAWVWILCLSAAASVIIPLYVIVHWIVKFSRERKHPSLRFWIITLLLWLLSLGGLLASAAKALEVNGDNIVTVLEKLDEWDEDSLPASVVREVEPFHAVDITGAVKAEIFVGEPQELHVLCSPDGSITTEVRDGVLHVAGHGNHSGKVRVSLPSLDAVTLTGASKAEIHGIADELRADLSGASKLDAEDFFVQNLHIDVNGASKAEVNVSGELWAQAAGASKIKYHGNPEVKECISKGASKIKRE